MSDSGYIEIHISGLKNGIALSPESYDIRELRSVIDTVDSILGKDRKGDVVFERVAEGSVRNIIKSSAQNIMLATVIFQLLPGNEQLNGLEPKTAEAVEMVQQNARKTGYTYTFSTSEWTDGVSISPETNYAREVPAFVDAEYYFYGRIVDAGGKSSANIHIDVEKMGVLTISASEEYLKGQERNLLYHTCGVRARGKQNPSTGEMDKSSLELISILDYNPSFNENYLKELVRRATPALSKIKDKQKWLDEIRGRV
jgi:hypothetical protein